MKIIIHPAAVVSDKARLEEGVEVGPFSVIGEEVTLRKGVCVANGATIIGKTEIGQYTKIFSGAVIGSPPQDLKFKGGDSFLEIGEHNTIREFVTINPGTGQGSKTKIGDNNLFMAYSHIAHDCQVGSRCIFANNATLAGHVHVDSDVVIGGLSAVHQFVRIGRLAIIGGCSKVVQDVPPFSTCDGHPAKVFGINYVGLKRSKISPEVIRKLRRAFKILFHSQITISHAIALLKEEFAAMPEELKYLIDFVSSTKRGVGR